MAKTQIFTETLTRLEANPELLEKLDCMRRIETDDSDMDVVRIELDILELVKSLGAESFGRSHILEITKMLVNTEIANGKKSLRNGSFESRSCQ